MDEEKYKAMLNAVLADNAKLQPVLFVATHLARVALHKLYGFESLHPELQPLALKLLDEARKIQKPIVVTSEFRTFEEQGAKYAQGRTVPGAVVTNAQGGQSYHNYGLAFDVQFVGPVPYPTDKGEWAIIGEIAKTLGLTWGGDWGDNDHFEYHPGFTWEDVIEIFI